MIPFVAVVSVPDRRSHTFRLWIPLFLVWLLVLPLGLLLLPVVFIAGLVCRVNPFRANRSRRDGAGVRAGSRVRMCSRRRRSAGRRRTAWGPVNGWRAPRSVRNREFDFLFDPGFSRSGAPHCGGTERVRTNFGAAAYYQCGSVWADATVAGRVASGRSAAMDPSVPTAVPTPPLPKQKDTLRLVIKRWLILTWPNSLTGFTINACWPGSHSA